MNVYRLQLDQPPGRYEVCAAGIPLLSATQDVTLPSPSDRVLRSDSPIADGTQVCGEVFQCKRSSRANHPARMSDEGNKEKERADLILGKC